MKILRLNHADAAYFLGMDPFFMLRRLHFPNRFALGAFLTEEESGDDIPAGLLIASLENDHIMVEWLYVENSCRSLGVGSGLLECVFALAKEAGMKKVSAYFNSCYGRELAAGQAEAYLKEHLFQKERELPGEYLLELADFRDGALLDEGRGIEAKAVFLKDLKNSRISQCLEILSKEEKATALYPVWEQKGMIEKDISAILADQSGITGALLMQRSEDILYPVLFFAETEADAGYLIERAMQAAVKKYPLHTQVHLIQTKEGDGFFWQKFLTTGNIPNKLLWADVADYMAMKERLGREAYESGEVVALSSWFADVKEKEPSYGKAEDTVIKTVTVMVKELKELPFAKAKLPDHILGLGELNVEQLRNAILSGQYHGRKAVAEDLGELRPGRLETDVSSCVLKNGEVTGLFLLHKEKEERLAADMLFASGSGAQQDNIYMICRSAQRALEIYPPDTQILLPLYTEACCKLADKLFPGKEL